MRLARSDRFYLKSIGAFVAAAVIIGGILIQSVILKREADRALDSWTSFSETAWALDSTLSEVRAAIGYGGFIHAFKNYVLRREARYSVDALRALADAKLALGRFEVLSDENADYAKLIADIRLVLGQYETSLDTAISSERSLTAEALDRLVAVDDKKAFDALRELSQAVHVDMRSRREISQAGLRGIRSKINLGFVLAGVVLFATAFLILQFYRTETLRRRLAEEKSRSDALLHAVPDGMLVSDAEGRIVECNAGATRLLGYSREELLNLSIDQLVPETVRHGHAAHRRGFIADRQSRPMRGGDALSAVGKSGVAVEVDISLSQESVGGRSLTIATIRDATDQRQVTRELQDARYRAETANRSKSAFLANMSHEIRTPLTGLMGMADLLRTTNLTEKQAEFMATMKSSGRHLETILDDNLDISRLEAGKLELTSEPFDPDQLVETIRSVYAAVATERNVSFSIELSDELFGKILIGDLVRLRQILMNLVGNAMKFTNKGSVDVVLDLKSDPRVGDRLTMTVRDTGIGIPVDKLPTVFDPFVQIEETRTKTASGSGLGLSICDRLAKRMGGTISVDSRLGEGTVFHVDVPIDVSLMNPDAETTFSGKGAEVVHLDSGPPLSVLVADDNETNQLLVQEMLKAWGFRADRADNGEEALRMIVETAYDVVLLDIHMPRLSGQEILERAIALGRDQARIYAFTADVMIDHVREYRAIGFDGVIKKPIDWGDLRHMLNNGPRVDRKRPGSSQGLSAGVGAGAGFERG